MFDFENSQVEQFYNRVADLPLGALLTFDQLAEVGITNNRGLIYSANKYLLERQNKMLINQRKLGYKMAEPSEQMAHAWNRKTRATRQVKKAVTENCNIDTSKLTADERQLLTDRELYLRQQLRGLRTRNIAAQKAAKRAITHVEKSVEIQQDSLKRIDALILEAEEIRKRLR